MTVENNGFVYKGKPYGWNDVIAIKRSDDMTDNFGRFPSTTILLSDGCIIRLPTTLEEKNTKNKSNFFECYGKTEAYKYLISLFEDKHKHNKIGYLKYLYSSNQIAASRMLIIVGLCFNILPLLVLFGFGAKFKSSMLFPMCFGFVLTLIGIYMVVKRWRDESFVIKELSKSKNEVQHALRP